MLGMLGGVGGRPEQSVPLSRSLGILFFSYKVRVPSSHHSIYCLSEPATNAVIRFVVPNENIRTADLTVLNGIGELDSVASVRKKTTDFRMACSGQRNPYYCGNHGCRLEFDRRSIPIQGRTRRERIRFQQQTS